jgi:hypothetical protein
MKPYRLGEQSIGCDKSIGWTLIIHISFFSDSITEANRLAMIWCFPPVNNTEYITITKTERNLYLRIIKIVIQLS